MLNLPSSPNPISLGKKGSRIEVLLLGERDLSFDVSFDVSAQPNSAQSNSAQSNGEGRLSRYEST